jgi:branched-chain amino acid transport system ATP-binding protein
LALPRTDVLTVTDLQTYYGESHVLQGVTMTAEKGKVTAVLGRNGVGKTTLCRSLVGLTRARSGRVEFDGVDITTMPPHVIAARRMSLVPQGRRVFISLTVRENLQIAARPGHWTLDGVFELFPRLKERLGNRGNELSGGEQQMLAIARALVSNPLLIILDEPTEGLAPAVIAEVGRLVLRLKGEGMSILLAEQNAAFAIKLADYVHVMSKGQIVHSSDPLTLWRDEEIKTKLLGVPQRTRG